MSLFVVISAWTGLASAQENSTAPPPPPPSESPPPPPPPSESPPPTYTQTQTYSESYSETYHQQPSCPPDDVYCNNHQGDYDGQWNNEGNYNPPPCPPEDQYCHPPEGDWQGQNGGWEGQDGRSPPQCPPEDRYCGPRDGGWEDGSRDGRWDDGGREDGRWDDGGRERDPCFDKFDQNRQRLEELFRSIPRQGASFHAEFNQARMEFSKERRSPEEWRTFMQEWEQRGRTHFEAIQNQLRSELESILGECAQQMPIPHIPEFRMDGGPGGPGGPRGPGGPDSRYADRPDERWNEFDGRAEEIRFECEERVRELMDEREHEDDYGFEDDSYGDPYGEPAHRGGYGGPGGPRDGPGGWDPELEREVRNIMRECEQRVREIYEDEYGDHEDEDFEERFGSFEMYWDEDEGLIIVKGVHLLMKGNEDAQIIEQLSCRGVLYLDRLFVNGYLEDFQPEETSEGTALKVYDSDHKVVLSLHDNPRCVINARATDEIESVTLDLADRLECDKNEAGDLECSDGEDAKVSVLLHGADVEIGSGNELVIEGKATFLVSGQGGKGSLGSSYEDAIRNKNVGAEVLIAPGEGDELRVDAVPLGDLEVRVEGKKGKVDAYIESETGIGKTVALEFAAETFDSDRLVVELAAVDEDGNEEPLPAAEASSLSDVLDPHDDGEDGVEYWIVQDKNGFHVLVSFAHFSEKKVTVQSDGDSGLAGLLPGVSASFVVAAIGLVALVVGLRSRRDE